jgi:hypothetical protein
MNNQLEVWNKYFEEKISEELRLLFKLFDYKRTTPLIRPRDFSFERFIQLIGRHRIRPLILDYIEELKNVLDENEVETLKAKCKPFVLYQMRLTKEIFRIIAIFKQIGIPIIPFKGPILSKKLFGSFTIRESIDLDFLIHPKDFRKADEILKSEGYSALIEIQNWKEWNLNWFKRIASDVPYQRIEDGIKIELHWKLFLQSKLITNSYEDISDKSNIIASANEVVDVISEEEELFYLCLHGTKHSWFRIKWLLDIKQILTSQSYSIDWDKFSALAISNKKYSAVSSILILVHLIFKIPLPIIFKDEELIETSSDTFIRQALNALCDDKLDTDPNNKSEKLNKLDRDFNWMNDFIWNLTLSKSDVVLMNLPSYLFWLYFPLRPFTFLYRKLFFEEGYVSRLDNL